MRYRYRSFWGSVFALAGLGIIVLGVLHFGDLFGGELVGWQIILLLLHYLLLVPVGVHLVLQFLFAELWLDGNVLVERRVMRTKRIDLTQAIVRDIGHSDGAAIEVMDGSASVIVDENLRGSWQLIANLRQVEGLRWE